MRLSYVNIIFVRAGMSELADEADSKSVDGNIVWVQVPLPAVFERFLKTRNLFLYSFLCGEFLIQQKQACLQDVQKNRRTAYPYAFLLFLYLYIMIS